MLHSHTLFTSELDIPQVAVADILQQMADIPLCRHTVGILICHYDHIESGIIAALQQTLPFPLIGATTFYQKAPATSGLFALTITILTSDDVRFAMAYSTAQERHDSPQEKIEDTYRRALAVHGERPSLIFSFISANRPISGDEYLRQVDAASENVPHFGIINSGDDDDGGANIYVICDGQPFSDGFALLLLIGDIQADMYINDTTEDNLLAITATVTRANGAFVYELNGQPAGSYLQKNGVVLNSAGDGFAALPFYYRMPGSDKLVGRTLKAAHPDGSLEFMAEIPEGALLRVGTITADDILEESLAVMQQAAAKSPGAELFFIGSCVGRFLTLGLDTTAELDYATRPIPKGKTYLACYVGGEICPIDIYGQPANRYHNNSFIVLALR